MDNTPSTPADQPPHLTDQTTNDPPRTLLVAFDNFAWRKATIHDAAVPDTPLYRVECHMLNPEIVLLAASPDASTSAAPTKLGDATFHLLKRRIDLTLHGEHVALESRGAFKNGYTFSSPARGGETLAWESESWSKYFTLVCLDAAAMPVARMSMGSFSVKKAGKFEIVGPEERKGGRALEVVLLSGLAVMQRQLENVGVGVAVK